MATNQPTQADESNASNAKPNSSDGAEYPFHTADIDGVECAGVMFVGGTGAFYEFQDPDTHDDYERLEDPRTGEVITSDGPLDKALGTVMGARVHAPVPADRWADFRATYVSAAESDHEAWRDAWGRMQADARTPGGFDDAPDD